MGKGIDDLFVFFVGLVPELVGEKPKARETFLQFVHESIHTLKVANRDASNGRGVDNEQNLALEVSKTFHCAVNQRHREFVHGLRFRHLD
eukprot:CAMPEP_0170178016 /NCGR_PEP_ID=MMETSP0040_2-20121228/11591_1 /TAXON_ID=641309 /ORGANISM="Lotharella oceanica, Strain CCMP622" /LENGTH=89 /DNA_ID=CAMNT_0010420955 /DNA_START=593 /DNA_END=862 /DNA_ORIENTATION=-